MPGLFFDSGIDDGFDKDLKRMNDALNRFSRNSNKTSSEVNRNLDKISKQATKTQAKLADMTKAFLAATGIQIGVQGVVNAFRNVIDIFSEFEAKVSELSAITGASGDDLTALKKNAIELGVEYGKSARKVVEAMKLVGSAKPELLENTEALGQMTESVIVLSKATGTGLQQSTSDLATIMNQFGLAADEANYTINVLAAGSQKGAKEVDFLAQAIAKAGTVAKSANLSLEQTVAAMELFGEKGIQAEIAGTGFKSVLLTLQQDTANYTDGVFDLNKAIENNIAISDDNIALQKKFGREYFNLAQVLAQNSDRFNQLVKDVTDTNTAFEQAEIASDNLQGDIEKAQAAYEGFILSLEDGNGVISQGLRGITEFGTGVLKMLTALNTEYNSTALKAQEMNKAAAETIPLWETQISTLETLLPILKRAREESEKLALLRGKKLVNIIPEDENIEVKKLILSTKALTGQEASLIRNYANLLKQKKANNDLNKKETVLLEVAEKRIKAYNAALASTEKKSKKIQDKKLLTYYEQLKENLKEAQEALLSLSGEESTIDRKAIEDQNKVIEGIEKQIENQEKLLGLKTEEIEKKKEEREIEEGSIAYLEKKLAIAEENFEYATSDDTRKTYQDEAEALEAQINALRGVSEKKKEEKKLTDLTVKQLRQKQELIKKELLLLSPLSDEYKKLLVLSEDINNVIGQKIGQEIIEWAYGFQEISSKLSEIDEGLGSALSKITDIAGNVGNLVTGISSGNLVQSLTSSFSLITDVFKLIKKSNSTEELTSEVIARQNKLLEEQVALIEKARGKEVYVAYKLSLEEINAQLAELDKKSKEVVFELNQYKPKYDLTALEQQRQTLLEQQRSLLDLIYKDITGTTSDAITQSILTGFENGLTGAEAFGDEFKEIMKKSLLQSFETKYLQSQFDDFYKEFGEAAKSGGQVTPSEMESLKKYYNDIIGIASDQYDKLKNIYGDIFTDGTEAEQAADAAEAVTTSTAGVVSAAITEDSADMLVGRLGALMLSNERIANYNADALEYAVQHLTYLNAIKLNTDYLPQIADNTRRTVEKLETV